MASFLSKMNVEQVRNSIAQHWSQAKPGEVALGIAAGTVFTYSLYKYIKSRGLPPGPSVVPVFGNYFQLGDDPPKTFMEWSHKYGKIVSARLGSRLLVVLHDYDLAKDVFSQDNTTGRDQEWILQMIFQGKGLIQGEGLMFKEHRRFSRSVLHNFTPSHLQAIILHEVSQLGDYYETLHGKSIDPRGHLIHAVANVLAMVALGARFPHSDSGFNDASNLIGNTLRSIGQLTPLKASPYWQHLPAGGAKVTWEDVQGAVGQLVAFVQPAIEAHREQLATPEQADYVSSFFEQRKIAKTPEVLDTYSDEQLLLSVLNIFAPGAETLTSTLLWCFLYMVENPHIAQKVKDELSKECLQQVFLDDKDKLPFVEATLMECLRLASTVPLGIYHTNFDDMKIGDYRIPARSILVANTYAIHRDPAYFPDPETFKPERFLDANGKIRTPKGYMPFYVGKRSCLAEHFAKTVLFLFFSNIMHRFKLQRAPGEQLPASTDSVNGILRTPLPYRISLVPVSSFDANVSATSKTESETYVRDAE